MIKNMDTNEEIIEKLMMLGTFIAATVLALFLGAGQNSPLAGLVVMVIAMYFLVKREQKSRRTAAAETVTTGERK